MTLEEVDIALEELETRLERLRALYEQYFLGFEKIEPAIPRKDVDRRIYVMRREKIRNTGRRFKLQTLIQRYNTFQQYWQRICREIENGTYRRHLLRAERLMAPEKQLTIAARRRFGKNRLAPASSQPPPPVEDDFDTAETLHPPARPVHDSVRPTANALSSSVPPAGGLTPSERARKLDSLELDMGFLGDWEPAPKAKSSPRAAPPPKPAGNPLAVAPPKPKPAPSPLAGAPPKPGASPIAAAPPKPAASPLAAAPPRPAAPPVAAAPVAAAAPPKPAVPSPAAAPPKPAAAAAPAAPSPAARPDVARPAKPVRPDPEAARPAARAGMSDDRVKELHEKLSELKRQNREAGQVSLETLAKTLRDTENKLRSEHKNRKIDFEVVLRDGKAIVKPTVR